MWQELFMKAKVELNKVEDSVGEGIYEQVFTRKSQDSGYFWISGNDVEYKNSCGPRKSMVFF